MQIKGWKYYNHAAVPANSPHENPNQQPIQDGSIWRISGGTPLLARWTTDFDCGYETNWWYVIKDTPFEINSLKAKRRYEINKGNKNFEVKQIDPRQYKEALYEVQVAAFSAYPEKYRPTVEKKAFFSTIDTWNRSVVLGAFYRETDEMAGYAFLNKCGNKHVEFNVLKTKPVFEKLSVNAAMIAGILDYFGAFLADGGFICDGARSINHQTAFQDYLEKYFGFRKAFCKLHVIYNPKVKGVIKLLYLCRGLLKKLDGIGIVHQINAVLKMEEIVRSERD